jgi:hypothetical protein
MDSVLLSRRGKQSAAGIILLAALLVALACVPLARAFPAWPTHKCSSFRKRIPGSDGVAGVTYRITVLNGHVSCRTANGLIGGFWAGKGVHHGGPSDAQSYWTLRAYPGWQCRQGAGAGSCTRHNSIAAYLVKVL